MSNYVELPVEQIELDISNPRIARGVAYYDPITSEIMALLLGSTSEACASLRESIRENKGIIHPTFLCILIHIHVRHLVALKMEWGTPPKKDPPIIYWISSRLPSSTFCVALGSVSVRIPSL